jgi:hypothetical protein
MDKHFTHYQHAKGLLESGKYQFSHSEVLLQEQVQYIQRHTVKMCSPPGIQAKSSKQATDGQLFTVDKETRICERFAFRVLMWHVVTQLQIYTVSSRHH